MRPSGSLNEFAESGFRTYGRIADAWGLSTQERSALIGLNEVEYAAAFANPEGLSEHALYDIGLVLGVYKALHTIFPDPVQADGWIRRPNSAPVFDGRPALDVMLSGDDQLAAVRAYLAAQTDDG